MPVATIGFDTAKTVGQGGVVGGRIGYVINNPTSGAGNGLGLTNTGSSTSFIITIYSYCNCNANGEPDTTGTNGDFAFATVPAGQDCGHVLLSNELQWGNISGVNRLGISVSIVPITDIPSGNSNVNRTISISIPIQVTI